MAEPTDATAITAFLLRAERRYRLAVLCGGAGVGVALAMLLIAVGLPPRRLVMAHLALMPLLGAFGAVLALRFARRRIGSAATAIERTDASLHNILITAEELLRGDGAVSRNPEITRLVFRRAAGAIPGISLARAIPLTVPIGSLVGVLAAWGLALVILHGHVDPAAAARRAAEGPAAIDSVVVEVVPPAYTGRRAERLRDPQRITALAGSRLRIAAYAAADTLTLETLAGRRTIDRAEGTRFAGEEPAQGDGFLAFTAIGRGTAKRLIGVSVTPDAAPKVRIALPGKDLRLKRGDTTLTLAVDADDDIGLGSLRLRYTRVSGSGERFTFTEGEVPLALARPDLLRWRGTATWPLAPLELQPGDLVVYRAVAQDRRPGAPATESDALIAEVITVGVEAAEGFAVEPEAERYARSQQMVILKTERLLARKGTMTAAAFAEASQELAMEQRSVRAEFIFMMGGELEGGEGTMEEIDEAHAEGHESDVGAGHNLNRGRDALMLAIRSMSRAAGRLEQADPTQGLVHEKAALTQLERAFSHARIILRALTQRETLDLTRRMTGPLAEAASSARPGRDLPVSGATAALRAALADLAALPTGRADAASATALAQRILAVDPGSAALQEVATRLGEVAAAQGRGDRTVAADARDRAALGLAAVLRGTLPAAAPPRTDPARDRLRGALRDAQRGARP